MFNHFIVVPIKWGYYVIMSVRPSSQGTVIRQPHTMMQPKINWTRCKGTWSYGPRTWWRPDGKPNANSMIKGNKPARTHPVGEDDCGLSPTEPRRIKPRSDRQEKRCKGANLACAHQQVKTKGWMDVDHDGPFSVSRTLMVFAVCHSGKQSEVEGSTLPTKTTTEAVFGDKGSSFC